MGSSTTINSSVLRSPQLLINKVSGHSVLARVAIHHGPTIQVVHVSAVKSVSYVSGPLLVPLKSDNTAP
eukprot:gene10031-12729_t